jgi:hypothetical protein
MKAVRVRNAVALDFIADRMTYDDDVEPESYRRQIANLMTQTPDSILFLLAFEQETDESDARPLAFLITWAVPGVTHALVLNAWCDPQASKTNVAKTFFEKTKLWAEAQGRTHLRMSTSRDNAFARKWKFKEHMVVMRYDLMDLSDEIEIEGDDDGCRRNGNTEDVESIEGTEGSLEGAVEDPGSGPEDGGDSVRGDSGGSVDIGVPGIEESDIESARSRPRVDG